MPYFDVLDALQATLETDPLPHMGVSQGDYDTFNESHEYVVVLDYDGLAAERALLAPGNEYNWSILCTLGVQYEHGKQAHDDIARLRQHCLDRVGAHPDLSRELLQVQTVAGQSIPDEIEFGGLNWAAEVLTFTVQELAVY